MSESAEGENTISTSYEDLSEENGLKVTQVSSILNCDRAIAFYYLRNNDWNVEYSINSHYGDTTTTTTTSSLPRTRNNTSGLLNSDRYPSLSEIYRRMVGENRTIRPRPHSPPIRIRSDPDIIRTKLTEEERKREVCQIFSTAYLERLFLGSESESLSTEKLEIPLVEETSFRKIMEMLMVRHNIVPHVVSCSIAECRLWIAFLGNPFLCLDGENLDIKILEFEKDISCTIDGLCFILEPRYLTEEYSLNRYLSSSALGYSRNIFNSRNRKSMNWSNLKKGGGRFLSLMKKKDEKDVVERSRFMIQECFKDSRFFVMFKIPVSQWVSEKREKKKFGVPGFLINIEKL